MVKLCLAVRHQTTEIRSVCLDCISERALKAQLTLIYCDMSRLPPMTVDIGHSLSVDIYYTQAVDCR